MTLYDAAGMPILPPLPPPAPPPSPMQLYAEWLSDLCGFCIGGSPSHLSVGVIVSEIRSNATRRSKERLYVNRSAPSNAS